jgi:tetratricopeptide (TPR) repeat protein
MHLTPRSRTRKPAPNRRQRVPPALTRGIERVDGISILDEISGDLGLVLWRSVRNVLLWAETPAAARASLFADSAARTRQQELVRVDADVELRAPLSVFADLLRAPAQADLLRLVNACRRVAAWADGRGALRTTLEFSQAAALVSPDSASLAYAVGRVARRLADYDRAESWYTRAVVQARESREWRSYASALAGMGNLHMQRGNYPAAKRAHLRCLHAAERNHVPELVGAAYHNLFDIEAATTAGPQTEDLAAQALVAYGTASPAVYRLAYDLAMHWILRGNFREALQVGLVLGDVIDEPTMRPLVQGLVGRAAGGAGDRDAFEVASAHVDDLLSDPAIPEEMAARTLLGLAHGALSLGNTRKASAYADEALSIARKRGEGHVSLEAESVIEAAAREAAVPNREGTERGRSAPVLAQQFVKVLSGGRPRALAAV